jgi:hypothetical protein
VRSTASKHVPTRLRLAVAGGGKPPSKRLKQGSHDDDAVAGLLTGKEGGTSIESLRNADFEIRKAEYESRRLMATAVEKRSEDGLQIKRDELEIKRD